MKNYFDSPLLSILKGSSLQQHEHIVYVIMLYSSIMAVKSRHKIPFGIYLKTKAS